MSQVLEGLDLELKASRPLFRDIMPVEVRPEFIEILAENVTLALNINTEKARSEFIVSQVLLEARRLLNQQISLFSGIEFNVDIERNLKGFVDFLLSASSDQIFLTIPIVAVVEAKNENINAAYPQCIAEMVASQFFNVERGQPIETILGIVTTGDNWKFLKLEGCDVTVDYDEYHIKQVDCILGIITTACRQGLEM